LKPLIPWFARLRRHLACGGAVLALAACAHPPPTPSLEGSAWRLTHLGRDAAPAEGEGSLQFGAKGQVSGRAFCNRFFGAVHLEGSKLRFDPLGSTKMACLGPLGGWERRYLEALASVHRVERQGRVLLLHRPEAPPLRFEPAPDGVR